MAIGVPRPCLGLGCRFTTTADDGLCDAHRRARRRTQDAERPTAAQRGYGKAWRIIRARILKRDPVCTEPGCGERSTDVDHIVPRRLGGSDNDGNLRGYCHRHHSAKTSREDSWNRRATA